MFNIFKRNKAAKDQAAYVLIMFDAPGPTNPEAEMKLLLPMVMQNSGLKVGSDTKVRSTVRKLNNATDMIPIETSLFIWLKEEGIEDISSKYQLKRMGLNANDPKFKYVLVGYAVPSN